MIVRFSVAARNDIQDIHDYIARENPFAAKRIVAVIAASISRLAQFPLSGRNGAVEGTRELVIARLPYIVVHRVTDRAVEIIAVFHAKRDVPRS